MPSKAINLSRKQQILIVLYELSKGEKRDIRYEDLVVALFKKFPNEFHLRGYPEYPDSGDGPQRILYEEKVRGHITAGNKIFKLTDKGIEYVEGVNSAICGKMIEKESRLSRYVETEIKRILSLSSFSLFIEGKKDKIFDSDFYSYLGTTVRADKSDFRGRLKVMKDAMAELKKIKNDTKKEIYGKIIEFNDFILGKFKKDLDYKLAL